MSYRTYIEENQIFGNNEYYPEWIEFIKSQGIVVDDDGCYEGYIHDFMGALVTIESVVMRLYKEKEALREKWNGKIGNKKMYGLFDFTYVIDKIVMSNRSGENCDRVFEDGDSLFDELLGIVDNSYAFLPYALFAACEDKLVATNSFSTKDHFNCYKLKDSENIHVVAR